MQRTIFVILTLCLLPLLVACNLSPKDDQPARPTIPVLVGGDNDPTPTDSVLIVTATPQATASPSPTQFSGGNTGGSTGGVSGGTPRLSDLSFSTTAGGNALNTFAQGVREVYARWSYSNVPVGTTVRREWYRDGQLITSREEAWSSNWGSNGRLTHVKLFDNNVGLASGNYYVVIRLPAYNAQIDGRFSILGGVPTFASLSFSDTNTNQPKTVFPYGTTEVFARWSYANIPVGANVRRIWTRDGVTVANRTEAWSASLGGSGSINNIKIYNYDIGGLTPGRYEVVIEMPDYPSARVTGSFTIEGNVGPVLSNLRFATTNNGTPATSFAAGTKEIFAIYDYANIPLQAQVRRVWSRNGAVVADRTDVWDFNKYGTSGIVRDVSLFDHTNGLASGTWTVTVEIVGQSSSNARTSAQFTISVPAVPSLANLRFSDAGNGASITRFAAGTKEVFALFDYANVPASAQIQRVWYLNDEIYAERTEAWNSAIYGSNGTVRDVSIFDLENGLPSGNYRVEISFVGFAASLVTNTFVIDPPAN